MESISARKHGKKDDELGTANMAALMEPLKECRVALSPDRKLALTSLETKLDSVQITISNHEQRLTSLEDNQNQVSDHIRQEAKYTALEDSFTKIKASTVDLESADTITHESRECLSLLRAHYPLHSFQSSCLKSLVMGFRIRP